MAISTSKYKKRTGVILEEYNKSLVSRPVADTQNYQLVMGSSRRGPFNRPVLISKPGEREEIFGKLDRNLEYKQSFFHRTIDICSASGPVWAINLMPFEEQDTANWVSLSTSSKNSNSGVSQEPIANFYNKTDFWERNEEELLYIANKDIEDQKSILHLANLGDRKLTIFAFKSTIKGFDITAADWYGGAQNIPSYMYPTDLISDYFIQIAAVAGDWTNYANLSNDLNWSKYFVSTGLIKSKFAEFINDSRIETIGYWDVCLIPYFRDKNGKQYFVQDTINASTDTTGLFASYDTNLLENTDFPLGFVDLIGNALIDGQELINFLSYKENILDRILFETKYLAETDSDGYLINTSGIANSFDETSTNVWFMPDRRELTDGITNPLMHKFAMTPQRNIESDLSEMTVVGLYTNLIYTRDYLVGINSINNDVNPAEIFIDSVPTVRPGESPNYNVSIDVSYPDLTGANYTGTVSQYLSDVALDPSNTETTGAYSVLNLKRIDIKPFSTDNLSNNYYVINGKKITFDKIINPNNVEDNYSPYITIGPAKTNWRTDVVLPLPTNGNRFSTGMVDPINGRIDLVCLNDSGHIVIVGGIEFTVGGQINSTYINPIVSMSAAIPALPENHICVGYITMGIKFKADQTGNPFTNNSYVHFFPVQIGPNGPMADKNIHLKYNTAAERILESRPSTPGSLPMIINEYNSATNYNLPLDYTGSNPYLAYQEPKPIDGDFLYYNKVNQVDLLFFNTNGKYKANLKGLFHNSTNGSDIATPLVDGSYDIEGPNLVGSINYGLTETTYGAYYHNEITKRRYVKLKNRLLAASSSCIIAQTEKDFNKIKNAGGVLSWTFNPASTSGVEILHSKFKFTNVFYDANTTDDAKVQFNLDNYAIMRAGKFTLFFNDYEQIFTTKKLTTALSKSNTYYNIKPNAVPAVNGSPINIPTEYQVGPLGLNSDLYKQYINGYVNNKDYFYQAMFATDNLYTLRFGTALDSEGIESYRIYLDRNDNFEIVSFEGYGSNLRTAYGNTVLAYTQFNSNDLYQDIIPAVGQRIYIKGTTLNDGFYTVKNIGMEIVVANNTTYQISYIETNEPVITESNTKLTGQSTQVAPYVDTYWVNRFRMYSADKIYTEFKLINNDLEVSYFYDQGLTAPVERITPLTAYIGPEIYSLRENLKQTIDIKRVGTNPNQIYIDGSRYSEVLLNDYLEAFIDTSLLEPGQTADTLTRILKKERIADDLANGIQNQILITCDAKIKIYDSAGSLSTTFYKSIDNYVKTLKGILLPGLKIRADLLPDGTEERQNTILSSLAEGTPIFNGLINKDKISYRYLVDTYGLGLQPQSKQIYLDLLYKRQDATGFINMPSAYQFRKSVNPSFINEDGSLNTLLITKGGDETKSPSFLYSFGTGYGQTYAGYFFPYLKINDNGRPATIPPASKVAEAYMRKFTANTANLASGSIIAGIDQAPITGILDVEMDFNEIDIQNFNGMGANVINYKMDLGFAIEAEYTAAVEPETALSYLHVREILIELEKELRQMLLKYQWKFNTADTRAEIKFRADTICRKYKDRGYLYEFKNIMDETNNPLEVIDAQIGVLDTFVEVVKGMGVLVNNVTILNTGDINSGRFGIV